VLIASLALAAALSVLFYLHPTSFDTSSIRMLGAWLVAIALIITAGAALAWGLAKYRGFPQAFITLTVTAALSFTLANSAAPLVDMKSAKDFAVILKSRLNPGEEVASYQTYYQDLPVYLERRITVVDWKGELEFGTEVEDTSQWMIDSATFRKRWKGTSTMYMLTEIEKYDNLRKDPSLKLFPIARNAMNILVTNKNVKEVKP
jgi:hypothetical protein